jgi:hypothetical protein
MVLILKYLKRLLPDEVFLTNENEKLQQDLALKLQEEYNDHFPMEAKEKRAGNAA